MRIAEQLVDEEAERRHRDDLEHLLAQPSDSEVRPCPECDIACACSASATCACECSPDCPDIPQRMSSEPDRYPIESGIAPLVYAFFTTRVCQPCWSCEGHEIAGDGEPKLPRVWFYSRSILYPRLVQELTEELKFKRKLSHAWCVRVLAYSNNRDTRFSLEPVVVPGAPFRLANMQADSKIIASNLVEWIRERSEVYLRSSPS